MGNNRSEKNLVDLNLYFELQNMQEEIAILLSSKNRSMQHPDYEKTYEIRISNVYTCIYRETLRMANHHSQTFNFFPSKKFRLRIRVTKIGYISVTTDEIPKPILSLFDEKIPIDVNYVSFGSRMNAYPIKIYFNCRPVPTESPEFDGMRNDADFDDSRCPVCPSKPQKCEVIVRACSDNSEDLLNNESEKQKYFFYFNVYMSKLKGNNKNLLNGNTISSDNGHGIKENSIK